MAQPGPESQRACRISKSPSRYPARVPIRVFEAACAAIVVLTLAAMARRTPWRDLLAHYALLACAGWIGEQTCISLYRFYSYDLAWDARLLDVPVLVPLIWPLVILSARDVATSVWPGAEGVSRAAIVGAIVVFDASLVEVVAVRVGLWSWEEGGHLGVPVIGILGWGFFAAGADLVLSRAKGMKRASVIVLAPAIGHALIVASWWAGLRRILRGDLGLASSVAVAALAIVITALVARARARGDGIPLEVAGPRTFAALLFFVLLVRVAPTDPALWAHVACVAIPYVLATRWRSLATPALAR